MKKLFRTAVVAALMSCYTYGQDFYGTATYKVQSELPEISEEMLKDIPADMVDMIKGMSISPADQSFLLSFDRNSSYYKKQDLPVDVNQDVVMVTIDADEDEAERFISLKDKKVIEQLTFFDKQFIINDSLRKIHWKIENETKKIGQYVCTKATYLQKAGEISGITFGEKLDKDVLITAWYTTEIPVSLGPDGYWGLPGLILEINEDKRNLLCSKIVLNPKERTSIKAPVKGKKVTREQFQKIEAKKLEELKLNTVNKPATGVYLDVLSD